LDTNVSFDEKRVLLECVENSHDLVMLTDAKGTVFYVNKTWERVYGYSRQEAIGKTPRLLRSHHQDDTFYEKMWREIGDPSQGYWRGELINLTKSGKEIPVLLTITPSKNGDGIIWAYMGIALDISERKRMEAEMIHLDRMASMGTLAEGLAHEMGSPLGTVRGRIEIELSKCKDEKSKRNLEVAIAQIDRIANLIHSMIDLGIHQKTEENRPVSVESVVTSIFHLLRRRLQKGKIAFETTISPSVTVKATKKELGQVLRNIILNSVDAIESAIEKGRKSEHSIRILHQELGPLWELQVIDTGCGISDEAKNSIFRPFFSTKPPGFGLGLGLPIAHRYLSSWNGTIMVESTVGVGTNVKIRIPKYKVERH
jgi:two-component system, cell cycle sensor histidine kinase and response regulator CckA